MSDSVGAEKVRDVEGEAGKVETAGEEAGDWHDNIVDEGLDDSGKCATDGDTDGEVNDAATVDKLFELLNEVAFGDASDETFLGGACSGGTVFGGVGGGCL